MRLTNLFPNLFLYTLKPIRENKENPPRPL